MIQDLRCQPLGIGEQGIEVTPKTAVRKSEWKQAKLLVDLEWGHGFPQSLLMSLPCNEGDVRYGVAVPRWVK